MVAETAAGMSPRAKHALSRAARASKMLEALLDGHFEGMKETIDSSHEVRRELRSMSEQLEQSFLKKHSPSKVESPPASANWAHAGSSSNRQARHSIPSEATAIESSSGTFENHDLPNKYNYILEGEHMPPAGAKFTLNATGSSGARGKLAPRI